MCRLNVGSGSGTNENARSGENGPEQSIEQVSELVAYLKEIPQESPVFIQGRNAALKPRRYFFERQATNR